MKRLVRYKLNFESKWLTFSGVMMGVAFFIQALDYFALRQLHTVDIWQLLLFLILPMVLEVCWCVPLRSEIWSRAEVHGVFAALICLVLLCQSFLIGDVFASVLMTVFFVLGGATAVLITFGLISHLALGMLVFAAVVVVKVLLFTLPQYVADGYISLISELPSICAIVGMLLFFGGMRGEGIPSIEE